MRPRRLTLRGVVTLAVAPLTLLLVAVCCAGAEDAERMAMARVRLTTDPKVTTSCTPLGTVSDDSVKDLRRKIVRVGGDTALLTFRTDDMSIIQAQVFRCPVVSAPPSVPPPPPGAPPPPPPGPFR